MERLSVVTLGVYAALSVIDSYWAGLRSDLQQGTRSKEHLNGLPALLTGERYRYSKFFLMPVLLLFYVSASRSGIPVADAPAASALIVAALICGFLGDAALERGGKLFLAGLGSFLVGHVFYIIRFLTPVRIAALSPLYLILAVPVAGYLAFAHRQIFSRPDVGAMKAPLIFYLGALIALGISAGLRFSCAPTLSAGLGLAGAVLFIVSDSLIALHMFQNKPTTLVMPTYVAAQLLIVLSMLTSQGL
jgi:uncharacterized membrane protein YhhN